LRTHVAFVKAPHLRQIVTGNKRFEFRCSFGQLACESVREGDTVLLKRSGGNVEAAATVGKVVMHRGAHPERVAKIAREYAASSDSVASYGYLARYVPPENRSRAVNLAVIELVGVRSASLLPANMTPRGVRSGWVTLDERMKAAQS
jgi:hypothetical protein